MKDARPFSEFAHLGIARWRIADGAWLLTDPLRIHDVLFNTTPIGRELGDAGAAGGAVPVVATTAVIRTRGCRVVARPLLGAGPKIRHDSDKVAQAILKVGPLLVELSYV